MAVKQNGVLATFTPTVSKYTNRTLAPASNTVAATAYNIYTCPGATLTSGKLIVSNNTGGALNIDVGIVEYTDVIQLDALSSQPGTPDNYGAFSFASGATGYTSSIAIKYANLSGTFNVGEVVSWTNSLRNPTAQTATLLKHDTSNGILWLRNMSHPLGLVIDTGAQPTTTFTGAGGATCTYGTSDAGTTVTVGISGNVRFYDPLNGTIYLQNYEFKNNLDYSLLYDTSSVPNESRESGNNNLNRSFGRLWRPASTTTIKVSNSGGQTTPATEFVDSSGTAVLVSSVSQCGAEQFIVQDKSVNDNEIFELNGIVLGTYQSLYVKSTGALTFTFVGFEETAEIPS